MTGARDGRWPDTGWLIGWVLLGAAGALLGWHTSSYARGEAAVASLALAFGLWVFWRHGGPQITAAGIYSIASAGFVGFAGLWWLNRQGSDLSGGIFAATVLSYAVHVLMYSLFWQNTGARTGSCRPPVATPAVAQWGINVGLSLALAAVVAGRWEDGPAGLALAADVGVYVGVTIFVAGLVTQPERKRLGLWRLLLIAAGFGLYYQTTFNGFGRLMLVALALGLALLVSARMSGRRGKLLALAVSPIALLVLAQLRNSLAVQVSGSEDANSGMGSVVSPLQTFGRLLVAQVPYQQGNGETFWTSLTVLVPRSVWPGKPLGFGAELTRILEPDLAASNHTMAALAQAEWWFNFGWVGLLAMVPLVGLGVRWLDSRLAASARVASLSRGGLLGLVAVSLAAGGLVDFVWVGSFTYVTRAGFRLLAVAAIAVIFVWLLGRRQHSSVAVEPVARGTG